MCSVRSSRNSCRRRSTSALSGREASRHFYKPQPLRSRSEIRADILTLERENEAVLAEIVGADGE